MKLVVALALLALPAVCSRKHAGVDASADSGSIDAGPRDANAADARPQDAGDDGAAHAIVIAAARSLADDVRWMTAKGVTTNPAKAGEGDLASKCDRVAALRATDPEAATVLEGTLELCAFDLPLIAASEAVTQLRFSPSQASRRLQCGVAEREIARARAVRPNDPRLRKVDARRIDACR